MDTIFGIARKRFNRTLGYWIVEAKQGTNWNFVCSDRSEAVVDQTFNRYSIHFQG